MNTATVEQLMDIASKHFKVERATLTPDMDFFEKLGINSFQALGLLSEVEKNFHVEIPDYELQGVVTFAQLSDVIDSRK